MRGCPPRGRGIGLHTDGSLCEELSSTLGTEEANPNYGSCRTAATCSKRKGNLWDSDLRSTSVSAILRERRGDGLCSAATVDQREWDRPPCAVIDESVVVFMVLKCRSLSR